MIVDCILLENLDSKILRYSMPKSAPWDHPDHDNELARLINHDARLDMNLPTRRISLTPSDSSLHPIADL